MILMLALTFGVTTVEARDSYSHDPSVLPVAAKSLIAKNFKSGVSLVKTDKEFGKVKEYEVILKDGVEITFDAKGNWKEVETSVSGSVPDAFVLSPIKDYISSNHKGERIIGIEKNRNNIEVSLSGGIELKFDRTGKFIKYED